jgi:hypothetical protein
MSDDSLRASWRSSESSDEETLMTAIDAVLDQDRAARNRDRWVRIASLIVLGLLCAASLLFAAYGKTPLVRGAYALMGAGTAFAGCAEWMYLRWSRQALPGPADTRSQLQTTILLLSRQADLFKTALLWFAPIFLGATLIGLWIYQERSHTEAYVLWAITGMTWAMASVIGFAKGQEIRERRSRMERMLSGLEQ